MPRHMIQFTSDQIVSFSKTMTSAGPLAAVGIAAESEGAFIILCVDSIDDREGWELERIGMNLWTDQRAQQLTNEYTSGSML